MPRKPFQPPTVQEVRDYILARGLWRVNPEKFVRFYEANDWRDSNDKPIKVWKLKVILWEDMAECRGDKPLRCSCGKYGEYTYKDDTGQLYAKCHDHRLIRKQVLPVEMTKNLLKGVPGEVNVNAERNRQMAALKEKP